MHRDRAPAGTAPLEAVGVIGATSFVGTRLLDRLGEPASSRRVVACSRDAGPPATADQRVEWHRLAVGRRIGGGPIPRWVTLCPVWSVAEQMPLLAAAGARRLVVVSSTSRFTKVASPAAADRALAGRLASAEETVALAAASHGIELTILRPTMTYDGVHDHNVAAIARFIRRAGFFAVAGPAAGLRMPVHADDVASACRRAVDTDGLRPSYELSGGETLTYREMVRRIFAWLGRPPRILTVPEAVIRATAPLAARVPRAGPLVAMACRMNDDLVFDHGPAAADLAFAPRPFVLSAGVLPSRPAVDHAAGPSSPDPAPHP
jgi:nucleoside-diphosphate-sugar epimerase